MVDGISPTISDTTDVTYTSRIPQSLASQLCSFTRCTITIAGFIGDHIVFGYMGVGAGYGGRGRTVDLQELSRGSLVTSASCLSERTLQALKGCIPRSLNDHP